MPAFSSYSALLIYFKVEPHNGVQHPAGVLRTGRRRESEHWRLPSSSSSLEVDQQPNAAVKGRIPFSSIIKERISLTVEALGTCLGSGIWIDFPTPPSRIKCLHHIHVGSLGFFANNDDSCIIYMNHHCWQLHFFRSLLPGSKVPSICHYSYDIFVEMILLSYPYSTRHTT